jgi:hypothetical protein
MSSSPAEVPAVLWQLPACDLGNFDLRFNSNPCEIMNPQIRAGDFNIRCSLLNGNCPSLRSRLRPWLDPSPSPRRYLSSPLCPSAPMRYIVFVKVPSTSRNVDGW